MKWATVLAVGLVLVAQEPDPYGDIAGLKVARAEDRIDMPGTPPPQGAIVLFDGRSLSRWIGERDGSPARWGLLPGRIMQVSKGNIITTDEFTGHFLLHVEFRVPYMPQAKGQARGNSGVYVQGRYEVQVLDSYGLDSKDNDCGGIYEVAVPLVNACKAPTVWQTYDIDFHAPKFDGDKKLAPARISVFHNGVKIHDDVKINVDNTRAGRGGNPRDPGPILLQDHGDPVQYRNIWLLQLK